MHVPWLTFSDAIPIAKAGGWTVHASTSRATIASFCPSDYSHIVQQGAHAVLMSRARPPRPRHKLAQYKFVLLHDRIEHAQNVGRTSRILFTAQIVL